MTPQFPTTIAKLPVGRSTARSTFSSKRAPPVGARTPRFFRASVTAGADTLPIRRVAKDGADLPPNQMITVKFQRVEVGEAYDYEWTPQKPMDVTLNFTLSPKFYTQQKIIVTDKR